MARDEKPTSLSIQLFLSSEIPTSLLPPLGNQGNSFSHILRLSRTQSNTSVTRNGSFFPGEILRRESPLLFSGSTAPADCHPYSSKEVAQTQSRPLSFSSLLAPTQGGSEFRIVHHGLGYCGVNSEEGELKKKTQVRTEATEGKITWHKKRKVLIMPWWTRNEGLRKETGERGWRKKKTKTKTTEIFNDK